MSLIKPKEKLSTKRIGKKMNNGETYAWVNATIVRNVNKNKMGKYKNKKQLQSENAAAFCWYSNEIVDYQQKRT